MRTNHPSRQHKVNRKVIPFYSILFGIYPVLALAAVNIAQIDFSVTYRAFAFSFILGGILFLIMNLILRNWMKAALLSLILLILFFSYGQVYNILKNPANPLLGLVRHRILGLVWLGLAGLALWYISRKITNLVAVTLTLNVLVLVLFVFPAIQVIQFEVRSYTRSSVATNSPTTSVQASQTYPDIYYIIFDGYMRDDNLKVVYDFDNSVFIDNLTQRGFYVANCSQSNYAYTELSLASSLNANYLDTLGAGDDVQADFLIQNSSVRLFLKNHGYTIVAFETGFTWSQWENADVYYKYVPHASQLNGFESLFLQTTLICIPIDEFKLDKNTSSDALDHDRTVSNLDILKKVSNKIKEPKFVFAHLIIPHPPYVYKPNGDFVPEGTLTEKWIYDLTTPGPDKPGYTNAILYANSEILNVVDNILADSKTPPIIIIQGDHGAFRFNMPEQRMSILNAYYLPNTAARGSLYPSITPVNSFRILFDSYFGQNLPLLPDISRYSLIDNRWSFETIPNECN